MNFIPKELLQKIFNYSPKTEIIYALKEYVIYSDYSQKFKFILCFLKGLFFDPLIESVTRGFLDIFIYFIQSETELSEFPSIMAADSGQLHILKYLYKNKFPFNMEQCAKGSVMNGHIKCLKFLQKKGYIFNNFTFPYSVINKNKKMLKYLYKNNCPWDNDTSVYAVFNGQLKNLKFLHKNGCPWDLDLCGNISIQKGYIKILKFLHKNGYNLTLHSSRVAALEGQLECLKYLHKNGCLWDENTCVAAAEKGNLDCLKYLHENGCPWDLGSCHKAAEK